ncbi:hypothetical protein EWM64_g1488 [Hericium alpestre]|uniref:O-methyltransferase C-terminal domain-containing protein n=1 Tax=Hericium alpestre TaxID=135208 RepID=A0A4Z0A9C0_9AGAM|nr:hypothetical protein EWM64_g1488 [Hericium alpestre]
MSITQAPHTLRSHYARPPAIDLFAPQPGVARNADLYILRQILHEWSDKYAAKILTQLRVAAGPQSKLLVIESVLLYACDQPPEELAVKGTQALVPPAPLLPNLGGANARLYYGDVLMLAIYNGQERTVLHFAELFRSTGWELKERGDLEAFCFVNQEHERILERSYKA